ncbi:MAG: hypothetical protein L0Z63_10090, partial [Actinobacteria bacterium]|nr:hypothetical protein [Actinomycetota bacterium]
SRVPRLWMLPLGVLAGLAVSVAAGVTSRALILDLIAWWPVWAGLAVVVWWARGRLWGPVRVSGLVPVLGLALVVGFLIGHIQGWTAMPSAGGVLVGPEPEGLETVDLQALIPGELRVSMGGDFLYLVTPVRWGGEVGAAEGIEETSGVAMRLALRPDPDKPMMVFAGWDILLSGVPAWRLDLEGQVTADLTGLRVTGVDLAGSGRVRLGGVASETIVRVEGTYTIEVPSGQPARLVGQATVPGDWIADDEGWRSPVVGRGWVVEAGGGARVVVEQPQVDSP